jgi:predicted MPP superfamily phosphohydrolase
MAFPLMNRRVFLRTVLGATVAGTAAGSVCAYGEDTHDLDVVTVPLTLGLQKPLRMIALGDIHFDPTCDEAYLARVVDHVNSLGPDLIVYTGDFVTARLRRVKDQADLLARAQARLGSFASPGNHELWTNVDYVGKVLDDRAGIRMLRNQSIVLPNEDELHLTGLDSFWAGRPDPGIITRTTPRSRHIVLAHEPDSFLQLTDPRIRLQISGHTHGGQVRVPFYGALILPKLGRHFETGLYERDGRHLYVNRGIGTLTVHLRINCRPEITVFELT